MEDDRAGRCGLTIHPLDGPSTTVVGGPGPECAVPVAELAPGTRYAYVPTADGRALGAESVFHTDDPRAPFTFLVIGDSGSGDAPQLAVRDRMLATPADFVLHTGGMVYESGRAEDLDPRFFMPYADLMRRLVLWPCLGNHDTRTHGGQPWRDAFYMPANNPAGSENYYSFDYGDAHVVVLDSNERAGPGSPQHAFLDHDLATTTATWKIVVFHHTIYSSSAKHGSNLVLRAALVPVLDAHRVDVVFMGHDHDYERTRPLRGDREVASGEGTVYVTTGGGGDTTYEVGRSDFTAYSESVHHLTRVAVDEGTLTESMIRTDGSIGDSFTVVKGGTP